MIAALDQLYDLRGQLEENIRTAFAAMDVAAYTRLNAAEFQKERPRVEIKARLGTPIGHFKIFSGQKRYDMFRFDLGLQVVTEPGSGLHAQFVARVDGFMQPIQYSSQTDFVSFPFITILYLRGAGISSTLKNEDGVEYSTLSYEGHLGIRPDAWPIT